MYSELPRGFTPEIIRALNLKQFSILCAQFGFMNVWQRMGWTDMVDFWESRAPGTSFGEFLRQANIPVKGN